MVVQELFVDGERLTGSAARDMNLAAVLAVASTVRSSYGPHGLDKMLVSKMGDLTITNDGATILASMSVSESAARILIDLAGQQDNEVGDGTTSVVLLAAALIERGLELVSTGVHPTVVASGYKTAFKQAAGFISSTLEKKLKSIGQTDLQKICESTMASKILKLSNRVFSKIMIEAIQTVKRVGADKKVEYAIDEINVLKKQGRSMDESVFVAGYVLNCVPSSRQMVRKVVRPKIVCLDMDLQQMKMGLSVSIATENPAELEQIREKEAHTSTEKVKRLVKAGANVILTTKGISAACTKVLLDAGALGVKRCLRSDLERIAAITGTQVYRSFDEVDGSEFIPILGTADSVSIVNFGEDECTVVNASRGTGSSIVLRGPNEQVLDEMERSVHDGLCALKRTLESKSVVVGGGAFEAALSVYLANLALSFRTNEQIAIQAFGEALLQIPRTLLVNAALDANELLAKLVAEHEKGHWETGLDLDKGEIRNNFKEGVIEPLDTKTKALRAATEAAISILRIDEVIVLADDTQPDREQ
ncbi:T-complex protein 1 subunit alpha [Nematocida homosporus]|uniref:T-complex protein 1 subunit alpha n=1 Tax=Nematocida homosporus TaxID=1912981 RepID=UPI00221FB27B|nr:T-complex protein 1 subunit alpha [Nematocida homosporus]KAI5187597.1 T-complex protein 1 subunit alpha [Nematocida homosporus]